MFAAPIHMFEADNKIIGFYESDREWIRLNQRTMSKWILAKSDVPPKQVSLDDIFNKTVKIAEFEDVALYGDSFHIESDVMASYVGARSAFLIDKISTSEPILETEPRTLLILI